MPRKPLPVPNAADLAGHATLVPDAMLVDVVVLTAEQELFQSVREAVGEHNPVWRAHSADKAADLLISGRCGVLVIDMAAVSTGADTLIEQIVEQFPDLIVCVAGTRADEPLLAPLISGGLVYRFMHKPTSARRAGMFLQAAIRRHVERREGREASDPLLPLLRSLRRPTAGMPRGYLALIGLVALALVVPLFVGGEPDAPAVATAPVTPAPETASTRRADPVLSRARAALQAGRLEAPAGRNALDLFQAVLLAQPEYPEAKAALARTVDLLLQRAQQELDAGHKPEAERLVQRVLAVVPDDQRAQTLARHINPPDTPSRQLSREQRAEVEARLAESTTASPAAPTRARTLEEIQTELALLPGPVTKISGTSGASTAAAPKTPAPVVRPDPLAPRFVNPTRTIAPAARSYAREPVNAPPTAGVTGPTARQAPAEPAIEAASLSVRPGA
ncbi:MAG: tetratricopeptide repeat protein [Proteobacteria bacterium]|nr:tetratricopeptide repeat protein [Pseudomonadota bacterium]